MLRIVMIDLKTYSQIGVTTMICPNCARRIPSGSTYCPECGFNLSRTQESVSGEPSEPMSRRRSATTTWSKRLMPNAAHLKRVGQFIMRNSWFLLVVYFLTLVLNDWRWEIFGLFILTSYLYPLLTGRESFIQKDQQSHNFEQPELTGRRPEPTSRKETSEPIQQPQFHQPQPSIRRRLSGNLELRTGAVMLLPSLIAYLVAKQVISKRGVQTNQILSQTGLGMTGYVYCIGLGILAIAVARIVGGLVKSVTGHLFGGQRFKRWGIMIAVFTMLLAVVMYQNATVMTSAGQIASTIGAFLMPFLPWLAVILYGLGIIKNMLTPQRKL